MPVLTENEKQILHLLQTDIGLAAQQIQNMLNITNSELNNRLRKLETHVFKVKNRLHSSTAQNIIYLRSTVDKPIWTVDQVNEKLTDYQRRLKKAIEDSDMEEVVFLQFALARTYKEYARRAAWEVYNNNKTIEPDAGDEI